MSISHRTVYESFASHDVKYLVIGGVAAIAYGVPRNTVDLDVVIEPTPANARALLEALREAGLGTAHLIEPDDLLAREITIFEDVVRVDVQTRTPGLAFAEAWERRSVRSLGGVPVNFVALEDLIATKEAAARPVDLEDLAVLRKANGAT